MSTVSDISAVVEYEIQNNIKPEDIQNLRLWLKEQPHLPHKYITDLDLIMAFHSCEYNSDLTKRVIDLNYTLRTLFSFYQRREVNRSLELAFETWLVTPLSSTTNKGCRPIYCQLLDADQNKFVYNDVVRAFVMVMDLCLNEEGPVPGIAIILNMNNVSLGHISRIDLAVAQQFFYFIQEAVFVRLKEFHFINAPSFIDRLLSMIRPFLKEEMLAMLRVHPVGSNTINDYIPLAALPIDAGGNNLDGIVLKDQIWNKMKANEIFFSEESKKVVDESKRPGNPKTLSSFFPGLEGSFKKLEID